MSDRGSFNQGLAFMDRLHEAERHIRRGAISEALKLLQSQCSVLEMHGAEGYTKLDPEKSVN